ncbi:MAG: putative Ig domain-containing protein, partial [Steroidobacteraceae bacterium]
FDADGQALTYAVTSLPRWARFDPATGTLTGTPSGTDLGTYGDITISVSDGNSSEALPAFGITVSPLPNAAPTISGTPPVSVTTGNAYAFSPSAADADGQALTFSISNRPVWATFSAASGVLAGTPSRAQAGHYSNIVISVSDGTASTSLPAFAVNVAAPPNEAPVISGSPATATAGAAYSFIPASSDPDAEPLTFSITNRPTWASFDTSTGALTGTPSGAQVGAYSDILITVSDGQAVAQLPAFAITVNPAPNTAPVISGSPPASVTAGNAYAFTPSASDADGNALTFSVSGLPSWASFNASTGAVTGTPNGAQAGMYTNIVIRVSDGQATAALLAFMITVNAVPNTAPVISGSPPASVTAGSAYAFTPSASDADGNALTFSVSGLPAWASFNTSNGSLTGTPGAQHVGSYSNIVIRVTDGTATTALAAFTINVAPVTGSATLSWSAPTQNTDDSALNNLAGFRVYQGSSPSTLVQVATMASPTMTSLVISNLTSGTYYFAVSAYTSSGEESALSTVGSKTIP